MYNPPFESDNYARSSGSPPPWSVQQRHIPPPGSQSVSQPPTATLGTSSRHPIGFIPQQQHLQRSLQVPITFSPNQHGAGSWLDQDGSSAGTTYNHSSQWTVPVGVDLTASQYALQQQSARGAVPQTFPQSSHYEQTAHLSQPASHSAGPSNSSLPLPSGTHQRTGGSRAPTSPRAGHRNGDNLTPREHLMSNLAARHQLPISSQVRSEPALQATNLPTGQDIIERLDSFYDESEAGPSNQGYAAQVPQPATHASQPTGTPQDDDASASRARSTTPPGSPRQPKRAVLHPVGPSPLKREVVVSPAHSGAPYQSRAGSGSSRAAEVASVPLAGARHLSAQRSPSVHPPVRSAPVDQRGPPLSHNSARPAPVQNFPQRQPNQPQGPRPVPAFKVHAGPSGGRATTPSPRASTQMVLGQPTPAVSPQGAYPNSRLPRAPSPQMPVPRTALPSQRMIPRGPGSIPSPADSGTPSPAPRVPAAVRSPSSSPEIVEVPAPRSAPRPPSVTRPGSDQPARHESPSTGPSRPASVQRVFPVFATPSTAPTPGASSSNAVPAPVPVMSPARPQIIIDAPPTDEDLRLLALWLEDDPVPPPSIWKDYGFGEKYDGLYQTDPPPPKRKLSYAFEPDVPPLDLAWGQPMRKKFKSSVWDFEDEEETRMWADGRACTSVTRCTSCLA